jgi:hypothetical protein
MKAPNIEFHRNQSSGTRADTCGQMDRGSDGRTDGHEDAFHEYAKTPEHHRLRHTIYA